MLFSPRILHLLFLASAAVMLSSCGSSVRGVPRNLPAVKLHDVRQTPPHSMARKDYPFDPVTGNYMTAWAAEGESAASVRDIERWSSSHAGSVTNRKPPSPVKKAPASTKKSSGGTTTYTIKPGDTLGGIAAKHKTTVAKIKAANGLSSDFIRAGKTLKIPR